MKKTSILAACGLAVALVGSASADTIWGIDNAADTIGTFDSANPGVFNGIGTTGITSGFVNSLEFDGSGNLYASNGTQLYSIDKNSGSATLIGNHNTANGQTINDFAWDGSTMWGIGSTCGAGASLQTIDLSTGAASFVCNTDIAGACDVGLTVAGDGTVFGHDLVTDVIYSIDVSTCVTNTVVTLPYNSNFGQGLTSSSTTNYHVAFNNDSFQGELYTFDGSGNYNFVGALQPLQIAGADVEEGSGDCLTLTVDPLIAGFSAAWTVNGATPGEQVAVVYGFQPGSTGVNGFGGYCATFGIQGVNQNKLICRQAADGNGDVVCKKTVPRNARGVRVLSQAAERNTCPDECVSNVDDQVVQ